MWRVLVFLGLLCLAAYGAVWLANNPETIAVTWAGREYSTSLAVGVVALIAVALLISFLLGAIRYVVTLPSAIGRSSRGRKQRKGHTALTRGIVAVGAGDVAAARRYAGEAERLLGHEPLALLLKAQAAQAAGNRDAAEAAFRDMADKPETRVLGLRGLYLEARRRGDAAAARDHAEEAAKAAPAVQWANDAVLEGMSAEGDWAGAIRLVERRTSLGLVDRTKSRRLRAVLLTADALGREERDPAGALAQVEQAVKLAPGLVPAAALAGRLLSGQGDLKRGAKIIETAWSENPHPELAGAYLNLRSGDSATDRLRRAENLARLSSWSDEARFAIARAAIEMRDFAKAREAVRPLLDAGGRPTTRLCMAMAEIEGRSGNAGGAREWLARAPRAARDKAWIADGVVSERWSPVSPVTGQLDAFAWETPPEAPDATAGRHAITFEPGEPEEASDDLPVFLNRELAPPRDETPIADVPPSPVVDARPAMPSARVPPPAPPKAEPVPPVPATPAPIATIVRTDLPTQATNNPDAGAGAKPAQPARLVAEPIASAPPKRMGPKPAEPTEPTPPVTEPVTSAPPKRMGPKPAQPIEPAPPVTEPVASAPPKRMNPKPAEPTEPTPLVAEPIAAAPPKRVSANVPEADRKKPVDPGPVVFPVRHAPDDPGPDGDEDRRQRFRLRV